QGIRRLGSAATDMAYVACGRFDGFYEYDLKPYDVAAGCILVSEAGGKLCDFSKGNNYIFGKEIVASNLYIFKDFSEIVKQYMKS
ncbi:MAG: inositol monophosphatase, partial [Bacteroidales bacterium]|nr:inositol monophosphatase [Bacteroidales bacterium]